MVDRRAFIRIISTGTAAFPLLDMGTVIRPVQDTISPSDKESSVRIVFDLDPAEQNRPILDWLDKGGYTWAIEVPATTLEDQIRALRARGWQVIIHMYAHPDTRRRHATYKKRPEPNPIEVIQRHITAVDGREEDVIWQILLEDDSAGVAFPQELLAQKPRTRQEAQDLFEAYLEESMRASARYPDIRRWSVCGYATSAHAFARQPVECVIIERANDDVDDFQTGIAFCRGAAAQYGKDWGIDLSLWWGPIYGTVADLPTSYHRRHLFLSYVSGARTYRIEGGDLFIERETSSRRVLAETMDEFGAFTLSHDPGEPVVPVAVMLPDDHGWMTPPYWQSSHGSWSYARIPYEQGYRGIDGFFGSAYPGSTLAMQPFPFGGYTVDDPPASPFALSSVTGDFAPAVDDVYRAEPPLPFGRFESRRSAGKAMREKGLDPAHYRPMGDSKWGDIFDVLTTEATADVLGRYETLVLLGPVVLEAHLLKRLTDYVENGGTLVWSAGVFGPDHETLIGGSLVPELRVGRAWSGRNGSIVNEPYQYLPFNAEQDCRVWTTAPCGAPLVVSRKMGKGRVISCLIPWFEGLEGGLAGPAKWMFDCAFTQIQPVQIAGTPVEWVTARNGNRMTIAVANHSDHQWKGTLTVRQPEVRPESLVNLLDGRRYELTQGSNGFGADLELAPFDVGVFELS